MLQVVLASALVIENPKTTTNSVDLLRKMLEKVAPIQQQTNLKDALLKRHNVLVSVAN